MGCGRSSPGPVQAVLQGRSRWQGWAVSVRVGSGQVFACRRRGPCAPLPARKG